MSEAEAHRQRYYVPGYVYIAGSLSRHLIKIGMTQSRSIWQYQKYLRNRKYGSLGDWQILYCVWVDEGAGRIEHDARRLLRRYKTPIKYKKDGAWKTAREIVQCSFSTAKKALSDSIGENKRAKEWQSERLRYFEYRRHDYNSSGPNDLIRERKSLASENAPFNFLFFQKVDELVSLISTSNWLKYNNIIYLGDLAQKTEAMLRTKHFNRKSLDEVKEVLERTGLNFGMEIPGWPPRNVENLSKCYQIIFFEKVDELELSVRTANCLRGNDIVLIGDLVQKTEAEMQRTPNFGPKSLDEIREVLLQMGLHLGTKIPSWPWPP